MNLYWHFHLDHPLGKWGPTASICPLVGKHCSYLKMEYLASGKRRSMKSCAWSWYDVACISASHMASHGPTACIVTPPHNAKNIKMVLGRKNIYPAPVRPSDMRFSSVVNFLSSKISSEMQEICKSNIFRTLNIVFSDLYNNHIWVYHLVVIMSSEQKWLMSPNFLCCTFLLLMGMLIY